MGSARLWLTRIHRWTGLALVAFLLIVGFTGALLPFNHELSEWLAPNSKHSLRPPTPNASPLPWLELRAIAERRSGGLIDDLPLESPRDEPVTFGVGVRAGQPPLGFDTITLDPFTGREIGRDVPDNPGGFAAQIMPFLYDLHVRLALGDWGAWLLGVAALAWTVDCFVGFYLTLPRARARWWANWRPAWQLRLPPRNAFRFNFDLHRAAGLWFWPMLFVFAWSSVGMNLYSVYDPVMRAVSDYKTFQEPDQPAATGPMLGWEKAFQVARASASAYARSGGVQIERERSFSIDRAKGVMTYIVRSSRDRSDKYANTWFFLNARTGQVLTVDYPTGEHAGNTVAYWLGLLHTAGVFGLSYRIFVSGLGVAIVALSLTGVFVWHRKRIARLSHREREMSKDAGSRVNAARNVNLI